MDMFEVLLERALNRLNVRGMKFSEVREYLKENFEVSDEDIEEVFDHIMKHNL